MDMEKPPGREFVNSLAKGLNILMCFTKKKPVWSLSEIARENDMNLPTARRYLCTLTRMGFMVRDEATKTFQLTSKVLRLGSCVIDSMGIKERLMPFMKAIRYDLDVTTHCAILDGKEVIAVERIRSSDVVNIELGAGSRLPVHATSLGKAIVAYMLPDEQERIADRLDFQPLTPYTITNKADFQKALRTTRERGYAVADQELTVGLKTIAVPLFDKDGRVEASLGVSYPFSRSSDRGFENRVIDRLLDAQKKV